MTIKDIMAHDGLSIYAQISLVLFFLIFVFIVWRAFAPSRKKELERMALLPLDDDPATSTRAQGE